MPSVIVAREHKSLVVPRSPASDNLFPGAPQLPGGNQIVVPHGMRECLMLRHMGLKTPNPMLAYYDWRGGKPFRVQKETCALLTENPRAYVLNHMGTGKTKCALWAWDYLYDEGLAGKMLVVAPLSTLNFVWAREAFATLPRRTVKVLHGSKQKRLDMLREDADIYVINHDGLKVIQPELEARTDISVLVLDELAVYRNKTDRSKRMWKFAERFDIVWGLTGAPMPNAPTDVWSQCKVVTPHGPQPQFFRHAEQILMNRINQFKLVPKPDAVNTAFKWMQPAVRFALDEVVELPETVSRVIDVDLSKQQQKIYDLMVKDFQAQIADKQITALNAAAAMSKLLQVSEGWVYTKSPEFVVLDATPRIEAALDIINSAEQKVIVFVPFRHALEGLAGVLAKHKIDHATVHGGTSDRDTIFYQFQNTEKFKVLLAHPECIAHGVTLTSATTVIWYGPTASLETYEQANARIRRVGQKHKQQILHLQATPVEKKIYALLRTKQKVQDQLLNLFELATANREGARS